MNTVFSQRFFKRGSSFFGIQYPILCGAMTWVSDAPLVSAVANAGGFGSLAAGNMPIDVLRRQIEETRQLTDKPFGVNLITIAPLYREHLQLVTEMRLPFIIFAGSIPRGQELEMAKQSGAKVLCFASTKSIAQRMLDFGADALILEGMEAGGHVGHVSLIVLLQQVLFEVSEVPVFVGGGIATGKMAAHLLLMGAAGIQIGTRFAASAESNIHENFKQKLISAKARNAISTPQYDSRLPVVAVRAIKNAAHDDFGHLQLKLIRELEEGKIRRQEAQMQVEDFWVGALRRAVQEGDIEHGSLMAGQSVGLIHGILPVGTIIENIVREIEGELRHVSEQLR